MTDPSPADVLIIGAGHNGLVAAGYLARAGLRVTVIEQRDRVGGACTLEEPWPGYTMSPCAYVLSLLPPRIIRDLELHRYGFDAYIKNPQTFVPFPDGEHLFLWVETARVQEEIRRFSPRDAAAYPRFERFWQRATAILGPTLLQPPPSLADLAARFRGEDEDIFRLLMFGSLSDVLHQFFESAHVRGAFAGSGVIGSMLGPMTPGSAYVMWHHMMGEVNGTKGVWGYVRGGMGRVSSALAASAEAAGATIRLNSPVVRILTDGTRAEGVRLRSGEELRARAVLSNLDPKTTLLHLVPEGDLDAGFRERLSHFKTRSAVYKVNCALRELPRFTCLDPHDGVGPEHCGTIDLSPSIEYVERAYDDAKYGRPSQHPYVAAYIQSATDPSVAPAGRHTISMFCQYAPYHLASGTWDDALRAEVADRAIAAIAQYAPNFPDAILHRQILSPVDMEARYGLPDGHIFHGEITPDQLFSWRPIPECAHYRTPLAGLYLCGSGTHPGGGVMGAPGHNAAQALLADWRK
jgi:phytoene dehydrogenase-like protein